MSSRDRLTVATWIMLHLAAMSTAIVALGQLNTLPKVLSNIAFMITCAWCVSFRPSVEED